MAKQHGLHAYEERYQRVFAAGALHWNDPEPNPHLAEVLDQLPKPADCVEFGCGEGYQARSMASRGHVVTGIDLSPTSIEKARGETAKDLSVTFFVGDVTGVDSVNLVPSSFDLAVNIGCLHMMAEEEDRSAHLELIHCLLKPGGKLFLQNGLDLDDVQPQSEEEARQLARMKTLKDKPAGYPVENTICTADGEKKIVLPLCPTCMMLSLDGYVQELSAHGFRVHSARRKGGANCAYEAIILAEKP